MTQYGTLITTIGLAKITNAQVTHSTVDLVHIALGDGNGAHYVPAQSQTTLKNELWRGLIADMAVSPTNPNRISISAYIPSTVGGFTIREVGLFDSDNNMIGLSLYPAQYKPQLAEGVSEDLLLHFELETSNASVVTLAVDPTIIIASRKYVDEKVLEISGETTEISEQLEELDNKVTTHLDQDNQDAHKISNISGLQLALDGKVNKQSEWIDGTLLNGWTGSIKYKKTDSGIVSIILSAYVGETTLNTLIFALPNEILPKNLNHLQGIILPLGVSTGNIINGIILYPNLGGALCQTNSGFVTGDPVYGSVTYQL